MVFNSLTFLIFLGCVLFLYYRLAHRGQNWMLLAASYLFYGWWDYRFLGLLLFTTLFDYQCALWIDQENRAARRKLLLASSMTVNLGVLSIFKYFNFFATSLQAAFGSMGIELSFPMLHVVLPLGISFYTFLSMSYTIDVYRKQLKATRNPLEFMLYVAFFPHLVAGPIVRASYLLPQCQKTRTIVSAEVANGLWLILMGLIKKVVIADTLSQVAMWGFSGKTPPFEDANSWLALYAFAFQIYGDFSGYSDIARGVSKLMGFELVVNFRAPYLVANAAAFWRHWHISLSTWLRDYLYIPLGGNRKGPARTYCNLMLTMFLGGLWHGAGAAYIVWGLYHGALLAIQRGWNDLIGRSSTAVVAVDARAIEPQPKLATPMLSLAWLKEALLVIVFFHLTCVGWLFFRSGALPRDVNQLKFVTDYLRTMIVMPHGADPILPGIVVLGALCLFFQWKHEAMDRFSKWPLFWQTTSVTFGMAAIAFLGVFEGSQFIYFQF